MAPAGARSAAGEHRERGAAVRAGRCGDGVATSGPARNGSASGLRQAEPSSGSIEVEIDGVTVRIGRGAEAKTVAAVLRALKAGA